MKVGYLYKKGRSIYLCVRVNDLGTVWLLNCVTVIEMSIYGKGQRPYYTELGKASEIIKLGLNKSEQQ